MHQAPGDAAGGQIVGSIERRAGQRIDQRKRGDTGGCKAVGDLGIRIAVGVIFDQQIDTRGNRCLGIGYGARRVARIVEIHHIDRQRARRKLEAVPQLRAGEAKPLQRHTWRLIEVGEGDTKTPRLSSCKV
jgi:hypothetical protein